VNRARIAGQVLFGGLAVLLLLNVLWIVRSWTPLTTVRVQRGAPAPEFDLPLLDGGRVRLAEQRGHVVLLDFWATWCGPCRVELPAIAELRRRETDVRVLAINTEGEHARDDVRAFLAQNHLDLPVALDEGEVAGRYHVDNIPEVVIVDARGAVAAVLRGYHNESELARALAAARR
jgi:thiol-disulfide isomerase/thioredoxin